MNTEGFLKYFMYSRLPFGREDILCILKLFLIYTMEISYLQATLKEPFALGYETCI